LEEEEETKQHWSELEELSAHSVHSELPSKEVGKTPKAPRVTEFAHMHEVWVCL